MAAADPIEFTRGEGPGINVLCGNRVQLEDDNGNPINAGNPLPTSDSSGGAVTIANGADVAEGSTTDAAASSTVAEDTTARTGIGLWKGIKNVLILINAKLPASLAAGGGLKVEGVSGGVAQPVSVASGQIASGAIASGAIAGGALAAGAGVDGWDLTQGVTTGAAVITDVNGTIQQYLRGIVKLLAARITTITSVDILTVLVTPTISSAAIYHVNDAFGGLMEFANAALAAGRSVTITKVVIIDKDKQSASIDLFFFDRTFTATADHAAFAIADADDANYAGHISVTSGAYATTAAKAVATVVDQPIDMVLNGTSLFAQMAIRTASTYTGTAKVAVKITVRRN